MRRREPPCRGMGATAVRPAPDPRGPGGLAETVDFPAPGSPEAPDGLTPRPAAAEGRGASSAAELDPLLRTRLRALAILYLAVFGLLPGWRLVVRRETDEAASAANALAVVALGAAVILLSSRRPRTTARLRALEIGMLGLIAGVLSVIYYRAMLRYSLRGDVTSVQLVMKNFVLHAAVLIVTFGMATPKRRLLAAPTVVPLAQMPFATLLALCLGHARAAEGLSRWTTPVAHLSFDALFLLILAVASTYQAGAFHRLRREASDARRLGPYRLRRRIGAGGMGEVCLAEHRLLKRPCAVKLIRPEAVADPGALARFEREVQITAALTHPNVIEVYDYGRAEDGDCYYVMEYLPGPHLRQLVERHGPLPPGRAVHLLRQVCRALSVAHAAGLIHRDIKPSNVIVAGALGIEDQAKLLDFGLVLRRAGPLAPGLTREGQVLGTPLFMAPEQATNDGRLVDGRSDLYALGAVAYYLLTGRPPFEGDDGLAVLIAHARDPVVPPSQVRADVPGDLERVVLRCLAKDPEGRFADAEGLERALGECGCAGDWGQGHAARWWRDIDAGGRLPVMPDGRPAASPSKT
ncbi:Serine/threonine-protein kinase PknB [Aquisphaera giovannonii]|uniref:non-specific serine/threonine protein kinase n=1 Tax=Aquisphaera giovannonii TaxID=406548 RepID=A0A5B9W4H8_9BACT|nr:serine/threonine-protein kinase [Aquisphaera giovannonii]QEH35458.1 Serine/threonine-protein kinase PknB [Aquisphaera giovannonii]